MNEKQKDLVALLEEDDGMDEEVLEKSNEIKKDLETILQAYDEDEDCEDGLSNLLLEDDYLQEELVDKLALLNMAEMSKDDGMPPESLEAVYLTVMDSFYELSKIINPMRGFGRDRLEAGLDICRTFEKEHWPLATKITADNIEAFKELIPEQHYDDVKAGRKKALGALRHVGGSVCAAGAVVYSVETILPDEPPVIRLSWINVHKAIRSQGIGNFLMAEIIRLALKSEGSGIITEIPVRQYEDDELEEGQMLENFLDSWKFEFNMNTGTKFLIRIGDIKGNKYLDKPSNGVVSLKKLGGDGPKMLRDFLREANNDYDAWLLKVPFEFFDPEVSCAIVSDHKMRSVYLVHRYESGDYRYEALRRNDEGNAEAMLELMRYAYGVAAKRGDEDNFFFWDAESEEGIEMMTKILPKARSLMTYTGSLYPPEEFLTTKDWDALREKAELSNDKIPEEDFSEEDLSDEEMKKLVDFMSGKA